MGSLRAIEMIEHAGFDLALRDHLTHGVYPPLSLSWEEPAREAIEAMIEEDFGREVAPGLSAETLVAGLHLDTFVAYRLAEEES